MEASATSSIEKAIDHCRAITYRSRNNLALAARKLPQATQQRLFVTTYASMRVLDDYIDDAFLALPPADREVRRADALRGLAQAQDQVERAVAGLDLPDSGAFEPVVFRAMGHMLSRSELGAEPWRALTASLRRDVHERPVETWDEYFEYCEGACIAPASVFIYVLGCEVDDDDRTRGALPQPLEWYSRDLAIFSYLVHLLRDLDRDAACNPQLLAIPRQEIADAGLDLEEVVRSARLGHWSTLERLNLRIVRRAREYADRAENRLAEARTHFRDPEWGVLQEIAQLYRDAFRQVQNRILGRTN